MLSYAELVEMDALCKEDERFKKYLGRLRDENSRLLAKITHEIGNPLTIIFSTLQLMETKNPSLKDENYWAQLNFDIQNLSDLLHQFADYSSYANPDFQEQDLFELLQSVIKSFEPVIIKNGLRWSFEAAQNMLPLMSAYPCDHIKLRQVFTNILKNAIEALKEGERLWIEIPEAGWKLNDFTQGMDSLLIRFGNNGLPIEAPQMEGIFFPTTSPKKGGLGIGLSLSSHIITAHGGVILVHSDESETVFTVCLPLPFVP